MAKTAASKPHKAIKNGAHPPVKPTVSDALKEAIKSLSAELLRRELEYLCHEFPAVIHTLEDRMLIQGKDIVRYHVDTDSEDDANSEIESEESELESESESESESDASDKSDSDRESKKRKPIAIGDEEYTARMAMCENCNEEFNVTLNDRGDCMWHPGIVLLSFERS
jgi:hypothetical protein